MTYERAAGHREVVSRLAQAQKSNRGAAGYSRWVNRRVGRHIAAVAYRMGRTPNQVTMASAALTFPAILALGLFRPTPWLAASITVALLLGYAFDSADGQVARLRGGGSPAGEWLDHVIDAAKISSFHLALAVMWFRFYDIAEGWLLVPLVFTIVAAVFFFALVLADMLRRIERTKAGMSSLTTSSVNPNEAAPVLRSLIVLPNDYGVLCLVLLLTPAHRLFLVAYSLLLAANCVFLAAGCVRWYREMRSLPTAVASGSA